MCKGVRGKAEIFLELLNHTYGCILEVLGGLALNVELLLMSHRNLFTDLISLGRHLSKIPRGFERMGNLPPVFFFVFFSWFHS